MGEAAGTLRRATDWRLLIGNYFWLEEAPGRQNADLGVGQNWARLAWGPSIYRGPGLLGLIVRYPDFATFPAVTSAPATSM